MKRGDVCYDLIIASAFAGQSLGCFSASDLESPPIHAPTEPAQMVPAPCSGNFIMGEGEKANTRFFGAPDGTCYAWVKPYYKEGSISSKSNWDTANRLCQNNAMHLATITTREERDLVNAFMNDKDGWETWIGAKREPDGIWMWFNGSSAEEWKELATQKCDQNKPTCLWQTGNPSIQKSQIPVCIALLDKKNATEDGWFNDRLCNMHNNFLCERDALHIHP